MNARSSHPAWRGTITPALLHDDTIEAGSPVTIGPACCCPAYPVVRVIMPATAGGGRAVPVSGPLSWARM